MNATLANRPPESLPARRRISGMTLVEMMTAMAIFILVMTGMFALHIFGMRYDLVVGSKLGASDQSRRSFDKMLNEIRAAKWLDIGTNIGGTNFVSIPDGQSQIGPAMRLGLATNFNFTSGNYGYYGIVDYYFDKDAGKLYRSAMFTNGGKASSFRAIATYLTNNPLFRGEDYQGNLLTGIDNHTVIGVSMEFYQYMYPITRIGSNYLYDYYKLEFKASSRDFN